MNHCQLPSEICQQTSVERGDDVPLIRNWLAITTVTESLVSDVINILRDELH
ncbi:MAG: hypothetical protein VB855_06410 [Pirellulaceae bacterium]